MRLLKNAFCASLFLCVAGILVASCGKAPPPDGAEQIVFFGDSITQAGTRSGGYISLIRRSLQDRGQEQQIRLINAGVSGDTVPDLERRLERDVIRRKPALVVIYIGINDVWGSTPGYAAQRKKRYEAGLRRIIARLEKTGARVILCTPSVIGENRGGANHFDPLLDDYANIARRIAGETEATLCDLRDAFTAYLATHNRKNRDAGVLTTDGVHMNDEGNRLIADSILTALDIN